MSIKLDTTIHHLSDCCKGFQGNRSEV